MTDALGIWIIAVVRWPRDRRQWIAAAYLGLGSYNSCQTAVCRQNRPQRANGTESAPPSRDATGLLPRNHRSAISRLVLHFTNGPTFAVPWSFFEVVGQLIANRGPLGGPWLWCLRLYTAGALARGTAATAIGHAKEKNLWKNHDPSRFSRLD